MSDSTNSLCVLMIHLGQRNFCFLVNISLPQTTTVFLRQLYTSFTTSSISTLNPQSDVSEILGRLWSWNVTHARHLLNHHLLLPPTLKLTTSPQINNQSETMWRNITQTCSRLMLTTLRQVILFMWDSSPFTWLCEFRFKLWTLVSLPVLILSFY